MMIIKIIVKVKVIMKLLIIMIIIIIIMIIISLLMIIILLLMVLILMLREALLGKALGESEPTLRRATPNLPTNIVGFREFDSSTILIYRGGIPRHLGDFPESLSPAMLLGTMLVGRLGV